MSKLDKHLIVSPNGMPRESQTYCSGKYLFTIIAPELLRVEVSQALSFTWEATQIVWNRNLGEYKFDISFEGTHTVITTKKARFYFDTKKEIVDKVVIDGEEINPLKSNMKGTARTLDGTNGRAKYDDGVVGRYGAAILEDNSLIMGTDGMVKARKSQKDFYVFATKQPQRALDLLYAITGKAPMIPRYAIGNWWSRYYAYEQQEYLDLMDRFRKENIKFTIATVDMDWHVVNVKKEFGFKGLEGTYALVNVGWTGYTWNKTLFPDYKQFLKDLKKRNLHTTLNLHPAAGVRWFETQYEDLAKAVGIDPATKKSAKFDMTSEKFINAYFKYLHRPYEKDGVDFWWIDWQQGKKSKLKGYDPLWACNHYHYLDNAYLDKRPMILSRYAGVGSHRYPVGFSGDTFITWKSLALQPDFTSQASNVGYTTWSHDICGHMFGNSKDDELYLRWIQYGVFSPICRLHSTKERKLAPTISKEPWNHPKVYEDAVRYLNLRHSLIPYVYTSYYQNYKNGIPICKPMYYDYPEEDFAYKIKNQYAFGSELVICPITSKVNDRGIAYRDMWVPEGETYIDFFAGEVYEAGFYRISKALSDMPVYAREGSIIPMAITDYNEWDNPEKFHVKVYPGNNTYSLYEDASVNQDYLQDKNAITDLVVSRDEKTLTFEIKNTKGILSLIPSSRSYKVEIFNVEKYDIESLVVNGQKVDVAIEGIYINIEGVNPAKGAKLVLTLKN